MKNTLKSCLVIILFTLSSNVFSQDNAANQNQKKEETMKTYVIERDVPGAGNLTPNDLKSLTQASCNVLSEMDQNDIQWIKSYVTDNKLFCIYRAKNEELIKEHAAKGNFPCTKINLLKTEISPATANQ